MGVWLYEPNNKLNICIFSSLGFGIIFNIKGKNLFFSSLCGGLGWFVYLFPQVLLAQMKALIIFSCYFHSPIL